MEIMDEEAATLDELEKKIRYKYGSRAELIHFSTEEKGGFLGLFKRQVVRGQCAVGGRGGMANRYRTDSVVEAPARGNEALEVEKKKILNAVQQDREYKKILEAVNSLEKKLDSKNSVSDSSAPRHPTINHIHSLMEKNDFSSDYTRDIISRIENELPVKALDDYDLVRSKVQEWISDSISIDTKCELNPASGPKVIVIVGPTGVGKTTTIAKLAYELTLADNSERRDIKTVIFTIDTYRIGAQAQIETYGDIMDVPVFTIKDNKELKKQILFHQDADFILIDTIGKSPKDRQIYNEMRDMLEVCRDDSDTYLALCATTKSSDIEDIIRNFEIFNYRSIILTKIDETYRIGNIISILKQQARKLAYITTGQTVPHDIVPASRLVMMKNLEGFRSGSIKNDELEEVLYD